MSLTGEVGLIQRPLQKQNTHWYGASSRQILNEGGGDLDLPTGSLSPVREKFKMNPDLCQCNVTCVTAFLFPLPLGRPSSVLGHAAPPLRRRQRPNE